MVHLIIMSSPGGVQGLLSVSLQLTYSEFLCCKSVWFDFYQEYEHYLFIYCILFLSSL